MHKSDVKIFRGPRGTVYGCPHCKRAELVLRGGPGSGRGYGMRTGGAAFSRLAAHIRSDHADAIEQATVAAYVAEGLGEV